LIGKGFFGILGYLTLSKKTLDKGGEEHYMCSPKKNTQTVAIIKLAIKKSIDQLIVIFKRNRGVWPADFNSEFGPAITWPTALLGAAIMDLMEVNLGQSDVLKKLLDQTVLAVSGLKTSHSYMGCAWAWGSDFNVPDLDSTITSLLLLHRNGYQLNDLGANIQAFLDMYNSHDGFPTFLSQDLRTMFTDNKGWTNPCLEMAVQAHRLGSSIGFDALIKNAEEAIISHVDKNGLQGYWYSHEIVILCLILESGLGLEKLPETRLIKALKSGADLSELLLPNDYRRWVEYNPFIMSKLIQLLAMVNFEHYKETIVKLVTDLISGQMKNGLWAPGPFLQFPYPFAIDGNMIYDIKSDHKAPMVTLAAVLATLSIIYNQL